MFLSDISSKRSGKAISSGSESTVKDTTTSLRLQTLEKYNLAKCADGSTASYYAELRKVRNKGSFIQTCSKQDNYKS